ncbi:MAG: hypothetical protein Q9186_001460 [Xanthomendoza sp. 1 TL-2023]
MSARIKTIWSRDKDALTDHSGNGSELALENLGSSDDLDDAYLRAQGHEAALQRSFSPLAALSLGFSITNSWVGYLSNFGQNLIYGGPQLVVFGFLVATAVQWVITLGLSEVASAFPSAGVSLWDGGILITRGRSLALPSSRPFNLGKAGYICNILAPILVTIIATFICFPPQLPVTVSNMNYTPVILVGLFGVIIGLWYTRGKRFTGPKIDWEGLGLVGCK